jgi:hypothetical protein
MVQAGISVTNFGLGCNTGTATVTFPLPGITNAFTITNQGSGYGGYTNPFTINAIQLNKNSCTGVTAQANVGSGASAGKIVGITLLTGGANCTSNTNYSSNVGTSANASGDTGIVSDALVNTGSGYGAVPAITFTDLSCSGVSITASGVNATTGAVTGLTAIPAGGTGTGCTPGGTTSPTETSVQKPGIVGSAACPGTPAACKNVAITNLGTEFGYDVTPNVVASGWTCIVGAGATNPTLAAAAPSATVLGAGAITGGVVPAWEFRPSVWVAPRPVW